MFGFHTKKDVAASIKLIKSAINKEVAFKKYTDKEVLYFISREAQAAADMISEYVKEDKLNIYDYKRQMLEDIKKLFNALRSETNKEAILRMLFEIDDFYIRYSSSGSLYVFRHCEKTPRTDAKGMTYDGIPTQSVKDQAMHRAKEIADEIMISPKKVKVVIFYTEAKRTKIFGEIIVRELNYQLMHCRDKFEIEVRGYDSRIRFGYWTDEALKEFAATLKRIGHTECFKDWYNKANDFETFTHQPNPREVVAGVDDFVKSGCTLIQKQDYYNIVIGLTHSWIIDAYLVSRFHGLIDSMQSIIETAGFFKVECGMLDYHGKWIKF